MTKIFPNYALLPLLRAAQQLERNTEEKNKDEQMMGRQDLIC